MTDPPHPKRAIAFVDGQNLFYSVKSAFGYRYPNYDVFALAHTVCDARGWDCSDIRFYTGIPDENDNPRWHHFWTAKCAHMGRQGIHIYTRPLRYRNKTFTSADGKEHTVLIGEEKGIDVRLALDVIRLAHRRDYDVALIFSQDQDLSEVADEIRTIAHEQRRWLRIASAFPSSAAYRNKRGINKTDWIKIDRAMYEKCIDVRDYRPKPR